ncbi:MAG: hypothetical protein AB7I79_02490 [Rhizobiaceae bacterium]
MGWLVLRSILSGIAALIGVPILVFFIVLILGHALDSRCGTPGDSGGCEMGAATIGFASALPGFALGFFVSLILGLRARRKAAEAAKFEV